MSKPIESGKTVPPQQPLRVLFVEDNPRDVKLTTRVLEKSGYRLEFATADTPELLREQVKKAEPQIIICDYNLSGWTAIDALEIVRELEKDIPVVILSGSMGDEAAVECIKKGATDYVLKDRMARLPSAIERALDKKARGEEQKRAVGALRESEERYRVVAETATDGIITIDKDSRILFVNPAVEKIFGYLTAETLGQDLTMLMPEYLRHVHRAALGRYLETGTKHLSWASVELTGLHKSGKEIPLEVSFGESINNGKKIFTGVVRDITERKRAEDALRKSEEQYRLLFEGNPQPMWVYDLETLRFLEVNKAAIDHYGYSRNEFLAMTLKDIRPPEDIPPLLENVAHAQGGLDRAGIWRHQKKDGKLIDVEITSHAISYGGRRAELVLANDVTERKQLEQQFRQSQKMEAVGQLAGGVAHDFNNLLTVINGFSQLLLDQLNADDPHRIYLNEIQNAGNRAASLTRQLLAFSRRQVLVPQVLDLNTAITNMHTMLQRLIGEDIDLVSAPGKDLGQVKADPGQIEQIIMNLTVNARDAMPQGGKLTIETANVELDESYARNHITVKPGPYVVLAVSDTGVGMDAETQKRLFEPFFTTKEPGKGTGLGLSTVYGIVKQSEGHIWVYSEPGHGTTFKVYLPRVDEPSKVLEPPKVRGEMPRATETILMVEDDASVRMLVRETLSGTGYRVLEATNGAEALLHAEQHQGPIHLMLTDLVMPGISGRILAERLAVFRPEIRVIYMSGYTDDAVIRHGGLAAGTHFLQKPFTPGALARKVHEVIAGA